MTYQVSRNGQLYGPYTLEDLQRYVASGNVLATDLAKTEEMADWVPVSQILGVSTFGTSTLGTSYSAPAATPPVTYMPTAYPSSGVAYADPPSLPWGLVLLFSILTCGIFSVVWDLVQALWMKRVQPQSQALMYQILFIVVWLLNTGSSVGRTVQAVHGIIPHTTAISLILSLATLTLMFVYRFVMKASLEDHFNGPEPIGLRLSGVMTFFFGGLYFQYHLTRIHELKTAMRYRNAGQ